MSSPWRQWGTIQAIATVALLAATALGAYPTVRSAGNAGLLGMAVAAALTWTVSGFAMLIALLWRRFRPAHLTQAVLAAGAVRFILVLLAALPIVLTRIVPTVSFLLWIGISYLTVLAADTIVLVLLLHHPRNPG